MSGARSRNKGAAGEREAAALLCELVPELDDVKRSLVQSRGGGKEAADLSGCPGLHVEVKRQARPNMRAALRQAVADSPDDRWAVAMTRADRDGWLVTMHAEDWAALYGAWLRERSRSAPPVDGPVPSWARQSIDGRCSWCGNPHNSDACKAQNH